MLHPSTTSLLPHFFVVSVDWILKGISNKPLRIFREGEWEWEVKDDVKAVVKQQSADDNFNWDSCWSVEADTNIGNECLTLQRQIKNILRLYICIHISVGCCIL